MIQAPFYYRFASGTQSVPHDMGSKGFCCLNIFPWTAAPAEYHHTWASPVPDLLHFSRNSYKGPGASSSRKRAALLHSWDLPHSKSPVAQCHIVSTSLGYRREKHPFVSHQKPCLALTTSRQGVCPPEHPAVCWQLWGISSALPCPVQLMTQHCLLLQPGARANTRQCTAWPLWNLLLSLTQVVTQAGPKVNFGQII